jgi:hypothetical protein
MMLPLLTALLLLLIPTKGLAVATVTGNLKTIFGENLGTRTFVIFRLRNFVNIPRVAGTGVIVQYVKKITPDSNGLISTNIYGNDEITPTGTYYTLEYYFNGRLFSRDDYSITGGSFDMNSAAPITTVPVVAAPTGDTIYLRLDAGNTPAATADFVLGTVNNVRYAVAFAGADASAKIQAAHDDLPSAGGTIDARGLVGAQTLGSDVTLEKPVMLSLDPSSVFTGGGIVSVMGSGSKIYGNGATIQYTGVGTPVAVLMLGQRPDTTTAEITDVLVTGLTIDANSKARRGIFTQRAKRIHIYKNRILNAKGRALVHVSGSSQIETNSFASVDVTVEDNWISGNTTTEAYGDGIYFAGVIRPRAINNTISDVTRIGIVADAEGAVKSVDALVAHNAIFNVHDSGVGNLNGAIWLENTNGGRIIGNRCWDLTGGSPSGSPRGIVIASGSDTPSAFFVLGNDVDDATDAISLGPADGSTVIVDGFRLTGALSRVSITRGRHVKVSNGYFHDRDLSATSTGLVVLFQSADIELVELSNLSKGTITYTGGGGDIAVVGDTYEIKQLVMQGLRAPPGAQWKYHKGGTGTITRVDISDSDFDLVSASGLFPAYQTFVSGVRDADNYLRFGQHTGVNRTGFNRLSFARSTTTLSNGDNNDVEPDTTPSAFLRVTGPTAAFAITGLQPTGEVSAAKSMGLFLIIANSTAQTMTIKHQDAGSSASNRIITPTGGDEIRKTAILVYDDATARWFLLDSLGPLTGTGSLDYDFSGAGITCHTGGGTITVTGAAVGDVVAIGLPAALQTSGLMWNAYVSATNTVTVEACDVDSGGSNPAAATVRADVWQH